MLEIVHFREGFGECIFVCEKIRHPAIKKLVVGEIILLFFGPIFVLW